MIGVLMCEHNVERNLDLDHARVQGTMIDIHLDKDQDPATGIEGHHLHIEPNRHATNQTGTTDTTLNAMIYGDLLLRIYLPSHRNGIREVRRPHRLEGVGSWRHP